MSEKKKIFPKLKKKISDFLADESGEITKKDALGIAAGAIVLAGADNVNADTTFTITQSSNADVGFSYGTCYVNVTGKHVSGIVNGHISKNPEILYSSSHGSHGSHSSW